MIWVVLVSLVTMPMCSFMRVFGESMFCSLAGYACFILGEKILTYWIIMLYFSYRTMFHGFLNSSLLRFVFGEETLFKRLIFEKREK